MPINEILAESYAHVHYGTIARPRGHDFRLYFSSVPTLDPTDGFVFSTYTDAEHLTGWTLSEIVKELYRRLGNVAGGVPAWTGVSAEMYQGVSGANLFLGIDTGDWSGGFSGVGGSVASAFTTYNMGAANRQNYRWTTFDGGHVNPQKIAGGVAPTEDDDSVPWFMTKSPVNFVTQDNEDLVLLKSITYGYNRKLARSYGKEVSP